MREASNETQRVRHIYDQVAQRYDTIIALAEKLLLGDGRQWVAAQARGQVLEIAIGTGRNLPFYSSETHVTGIEISPAMLQIARQRAAALHRDVGLMVGDAQTLPFADASLDTVVATLALCSIPDDQRAVSEAKRVLRPGGRFLLLEHVKSPLRPVQAIQQLLAPLFVRFYADHLLREPLDVVARAGFVVDRLERSAWGIVERLVAYKPVISDS